MQSVYNCQGTHKKLRIIHEFELYKFESDKFDCMRIVHPVIICTLQYGARYIQRQKPLYMVKKFLHYI